MIVNKLSLLLSTLFFFSALEASPLCSRTQLIMGTYATITLPCTQKESIELGFNSLKNSESSLSSYDKNARLYKLNHERSVVLDTSLLSALEISKQLYVESDGYFDISIGSLTKSLFHFGQDERLPSQKELAEAKVGLSGLHIKEGYATLDTGVVLDLGGMGKGFGVDIAFSALERAGVKEGSIALSGDIRLFSAQGIQIQDPFSEGILLSFTTKEGDLGISTSGNYRRYVKDKKNNHLIDPKKRASQQIFASITLISHLDSVYLDAYATAASVMPLKRAISFLNGFDLGYYLVLNDGREICSEEFELFIDKKEPYLRSSLFRGALYKM